MSCGVGHKCGSDLLLLWLHWYRLAALAPIRPLAWEPPYAASVALEKTGEKKKKGLSLSYSSDNAKSLTTRPSGNSFTLFYSQHLSQSEFMYLLAFLKSASTRRLVPGMMFVLFTPHVERSIKKHGEKKAKNKQKGVPIMTQWKRI